jgi:hypothetical protein
MNEITPFSMKPAAGQWSVDRPMILPLDGPVRPLVEPISIATCAWGPFSRLHMEGMVGPYKYAVSTGAFEATEAPEGQVRIATVLHVLLPRAVASVDIVIVRDDSGVTMSTDIHEQADLPLDPATRQLLHQQLSQPIGGFLSRRTFRAGDVFDLSARNVHGDVSNGLALVGQIVGQSEHLGRPVLVATCYGAHGISDSAWNGCIRVDGNLAIDIETGVVLISCLDGYIFGSSIAETVQIPLAPISIRAWFSVSRHPLH